MKILSPTGVSTLGTVAVGALAFSMSFTALSELASDNGVGQGWMLPLVVDGGVVVATSATIALRQNRWFAWVLLVMSSMVSVAGNVAHANTHQGTVIAMVIAAIPPVWLLAATHLTVMLSRQGKPAHSENAADPSPRVLEPLAA